MVKLEKNRINTVLMHSYIHDKKAMGFSPAQMKNTIGTFNPVAEMRYI